MLLTLRYQRDGDNPFELNNILLNLLLHVCQNVNQFISMVNFKVNCVYINVCIYTPFYQSSLILLSIQTSKNLKKMNSKLIRDFS